MKRSVYSLITVVLVISMLLGVLASCGGNSEAGESSEVKTDAATESTTSESQDTTAESTTDEATSTTEETTDNTEITQSQASSETTESETVESSVETSETSNVPDESTEEESTLITGEYAGLIEGAEALKNGVQAGFSEGGNRDNFWLYNSEMKFNYSLKAESDQLVTALTNKDGVAYITNTMDVFVRMKDGVTYFASGSTSNATANLYRIGMYYYEARFEEQNFFNNPEFTEGTPLEGWSVDTSRSHNVNVNDDGTITIANSNDPYMIFKDVEFSANQYNVLKVKLRAVKGTKGTCTVYTSTTSSGGFDSARALSFTFSTDGKYNEVLVPLYDIKNYGGTLTDLRFDIDGASGDTYEIAEITPCNLNVSPKGPMNLRLCRSFFVYTDKMHHDIQIAALDTVKNITEVGMLTTIDANTVAAVVVKDATGLHYSFDGVDWATAEYVGFDIKDAGVFGYILPVHEYAGTIKVTLADGIYSIEQTRTPNRGGIEPSEEGTLNGNDFHLSQRIYTDNNHSFNEFIREAEIERNPINAYIRVSETEYTTANFVGYDPIRGIYVIDIGGPGTFNPPYYSQQNRYYSAEIVVRSPDDRTIYLMTRTGAGSMECSVLTSKKNVLIPIPVSVCKNFSEAAGERNLYNLDDDDYSESFFPLTLKANSKHELTVVNLYQNWGHYPLKQISSIQFRAPYYHLSTGVTESNCILPWFETKRTGIGTLPDFRAMSAPLWETQPQRNSGGAHTWLEYTDADGNYSAAENYADFIDSYGPTYADVTMENLSYDGRIKATYTHMEMPQTDENRTYYEIKYEVLEEIKIKDFKNDFTFYAVTDNEPAKTADYRQIGYLNENNECVTTASNLEDGTVKEYILGNDHPYFSMFDMPYDASPDGYTNVAFLVYNSKFIINGEENNASFVIINSYNKIDLSLDLGEITLKAGDSFTINAILMPWGSHESDYTDGDVNVRAVRENTILNPLTISSETDTVIESVYVPKVRSTDGLTATFTLKDGYNNVAVRAYGFTKLTVPTLYEFIDNEWVKVEISSSAKPDNSGYYHYFDGYMVHYDGDGTYSYSFVTDMENGKERTFKLDLSEDVNSLPASGKLEAPNYLDIYYDASEIQTLINGSGIYSTKFSSMVVSEDQSYVSLYPKADVLESFFMIRPQGDEISGKYIAVKYRVPTTNTQNLANFEFFISTSSETPASGENLKYSNIKQDGEWHILLIDASTFSLPTFKPDDNGVYNISYVRFDVLNVPNLAENNYIDLAFFGMCDSIEEVCDLASEDFEKIDFYTAQGESQIITSSGEIVSPEGSDNYKNIYYNAEGIKTIIEGSSVYSPLFSNKVVSSDKSYLSLYANAKSESFFLIRPEAGEISGEFIYVKYRIPTTNTQKLNNFEFYLSSTSSQPASGENFRYSQLKQDGEWHVLIIDASTFSLPTFKADANGVYNISYIRFDILNTPNLTSNNYIDIGYFGMSDSLEEIYDLAKNEFETVHLYTNAGETEIVTKTGLPVVGKEYLDPNSGYTKSTLAYYSVIDTIASATLNTNGNSADGVCVAKNVTVPTGEISISGWAVVEGGIDHIVWSPDGGKTWIKIEATLGAASDNILNHAQNKLTAALGTSFSFSDKTATKAHSTFQSTKLIIDLSEYAGQKIDFVIAAVPTKDTNTLCLMTAIDGLTVTAAN